MVWAMEGIDGVTEGDQLGAGVEVTRREMEF